MSTRRKIEANGRNAKYSTGPKTQAGRSNSKWNALKHGLTAASVVVPGEDPLELERLHRELLEAWEPANAMEAALVWRLAMAQWQLRRSLIVEALMIESVIVDAQCDLAEEDATLTSTSISNIDWSASQLDEKDIETRHKLEQEMKQLIEKKPYLEAKLSKNKDEQRKRIGNLGAAFYRLSGNQGGIMAVLRYRTACEGIYYRALLTLERLQTNRKSGSEPIE